MQCAVRRWGPGTTKERPTNTAASKELQERLAALNAERSNQDSMWGTQSTQSTEIKQLKQSKQSKQPNQQSNQNQAYYPTSS